MTTSFALYRDLTPPTSVDFSLSSHFTSSSVTNLILVKSNTLEIYTVDIEIAKKTALRERKKQREKEQKNKKGGENDNHNEELNGNGNNNENGLEDALPFAFDSISTTNNSTTTSSSQFPPPLHRIGSYTFFSLISSCNSIRLPSQSRDSLLVSFPDAKISLIHWDTNNYDIITIDICSAGEKEREAGNTPSAVERQQAATEAAAAAAATAAGGSAAAGGGTEVKKSVESSSLSLSQQIRLNLPSTPRVRVDPLHRCAALLIYDNQLLIFPFHQTSSLHTSLTSVFQSIIDPSSHPLPPTPGRILSPYFIDLSTKGITNIHDFQFLEGYHEPSILLLHEIRSTFSGRYAVAKQTCQLLTMSLQLDTKTSSLLVSSSPLLPHDSYSIYPIPLPHTGAIILSVNIVFHYNNKSIDSALALNEVGDSDYRFYHLEKSPLICNFDRCSIGFLSSTSILISSSFSQNPGETYLLSYEPSGVGIKNMKVEKIGFLVAANNITIINNNIMFMGVRHGQNLLVEYKKETDEYKKQKKKLLNQGGDDKKGNNKNGFNNHNTTIKEEKEFDELFGDTDNIDGNNNKDNEDNNNDNNNAATTLANAAAAQSIMKAMTGNDELFDELYATSLFNKQQAQREAERQLQQQSYTQHDYSFIVIDTIVGTAPIIDMDIQYRREKQDEEEQQMKAQKEQEERQRQQEEKLNTVIESSPLCYEPGSPALLPPSPVPLCHCHRRDRKRSYYRRTNFTRSPGTEKGYQLKQDDYLWTEEEKQRDQDCSNYCTSSYNEECKDIPIKFSRQLKISVNDFPNGISDIHLDAANAACENLNVGCIVVQIFRSELFILSFRTAPQTRMEATLLMLQELLQHFSDIPDVIMLLWWHDRQMIKNPDPIFPLFGFNTLAKKHWVGQFLMPDWGFFNWPESRMVEFERMSAEMNTIAEEVPFEERRKRLFFRGADLTEYIDLVNPGAPNYRPPLVRQTMNNSDILDAKWITWDSWRLSPSLGSPVSMSEHCRYAYLSNVEAVAWSGRLKYLVMCGNVLVTHEPKHLEYWYDIFVDGVSYIKTMDMSEDVVPIMKKLLANETYSKEVGSNLQRLAWQYINRDAMFCYYRMLLLQYNSLLEKGGATKHKTLAPASINVKDFIIRSWKGADLKRQDVINIHDDLEIKRQQAEKTSFELEKKEGYHPPVYQPQFVDLQKIKEEKLRQEQEKLQQEKLNEERLQQERLHAAKLEVPVKSGGVLSGWSIGWLVNCIISQLVVQFLL